MDGECSKYDLGSSWHPDTLLCIQKQYGCFWTHKANKKHRRFQTTRYVSNIKSPFFTLHPLNLPAVETLETKLRNSRTEATRLEDLESFKARLQYVQVQLDQSKSKLPTFEVVVVFFLDQKEIRKLLCFVFFLHHLSGEGC